MQIIFAFTINPETQEATFAGNIEIQVALQILQQLVIADAIKKAKEQEEKKDESPPTGQAREEPAIIKEKDERT